MSRVARCVWVFVVGSALALAATAHAQTYPTRPIRLIVSFAPGAGADVIARLVAPRITDSLGQQVIVDNRTGAGGIVGSDIVAKAAPDGHTVILAINSHAINASLYSKLPYDTRKDFAPVTLVASGPLVLAVNPNLPANTVKDLIGYVKSKPGQLSYASAGVGTPTHLAGELLKTMAGIDMAHVPYKGGPPTMAAVVAGEVLLFFSGTAVALPTIKAGRIKALGVTSKARSPLLPGTPTMAESGLQGYDVEIWYGLLAPGATPRSIVGRLHAEFTRALQVPEVRERLTALGLEPIGSTPAQFGAYLNAEILKWEKVVKASGARAD